MLNLLEYGFNSVSCIMISYSAFAFFITMDPPKDWLGYFIRVALAGICASSLLTGIMPIWLQDNIPWWSHALRASSALFALLMFHKFFGIQSQVRYAIEGLSSVWSGIKGSYEQIMDFPNQVKRCIRKKMIENTRRNR